MNGKGITSTNSRGKFSLSITSQISRVALTITDSIFNQLIDTTRVVVIKKNTNVFIPIQIKVRPSPIQVRSMDKTVIPLTSEALPPFAEIVIPPNSIYKIDGERYNGDVLISVNTIDMRNQSNVDFAEGDFTAIEENGEREILRSNGMVGIELTDLEWASLNSRRVCSYIC